MSRTAAGSDFATQKAENSRLLREDVAARRTTYRGLPEVVTLNHSDLCNLRCVMCQRSLAQGTHRLDQGALDHVVNELFPTARKAVLTTAGGDPLVVDFEFLLERALRFGVRLDVVTNGLLLTRDLYRHSREALDHLNISLDSHVPAIYERIRAGASFARVMQRLEDLAEERRREPDGVLLSVSAVVMKSNLPLLADFVRAVAPLQPDGIVLQRLQHGEKATPAEEPTSVFTPAEIERHFVAAERTAAELGVNLFLSEFHRPNVVPAPPRPKVPMTIEGQGLCWFLAQNFNVMYTGEVYPCCIPTDLCLGDVRYQDPAEIWNGAPFRQLREQHLSGAGNLFCSGCLHAPHLPAAILPAVEAERERRAKAYELESARTREREAGRRQPIYAPAPPKFEAMDGVFADGRMALVESEPVAIDTSATGPGALLALREGMLEWRTPNREVLRRIDLSGPARGARGTCVHATHDGAALVAFAERGQLLRVDERGVHCALELGDPRSFVRTSGIARTVDGSLWVGEYGVFPGARCARLYRSDDDGHTFELVTHFAAARHVHRVLATAEGPLLVTTGDLAGERRLYRGHGRDFPCLVPCWAGFVAAVEVADEHHFGTDLMQGNGLVAYRRGLTLPPEYRAFPSSMDLQVRALACLGDGALVALLGMDATVTTRRRGKQPLLLQSRDRGHTWSVVHRFPADWTDEPDDLIRLDGSRIWAVGGTANHVIELRSHT